jgi:hypothetical protein
MAQTDVREYAAQAASSGAFGRVLACARNHHFVVDGLSWRGHHSRLTILFGRRMLRP